MHPEVTSHDWNGQYTQFHPILCIFIPYQIGNMGWNFFWKFHHCFLFGFKVLTFGLLLLTIYKLQSASWSIHGSILEIVVHIQSVWFFINLNYHICKSYITNCLFHSNFYESSYSYVFAYHEYTVMNAFLTSFGWICCGFTSQIACPEITPCTRLTIKDLGLLVRRVLFCLVF